MPKSNISPRASRVNNLTIENIKGTRSLCKNSLPVVAMSLEIALSSFSKFIQKHCCINSSGTKSIPVLIGHNAAVFDVPIRGVHRVGYKRSTRPDKIFNKPEHDPIPERRKPDPTQSE